MYRHFGLIVHTDLINIQAKVTMSVLYVPQSGHKILTKLVHSSHSSYLCVLGTDVTAKVPLVGL